MKPEYIFYRLLNKRGDGEVIEGIVGAIIFIGILVWIASDTYGWENVIIWFAVMIAGIIGIAYLVKAASDSGTKEAQYNSKRQENAALELKLQEQLKRHDEEERIKKVRERIASERQSYDAYKTAISHSCFSSDLEKTTALIDKMFNDKDIERKEKALSFFNKYLPLMTDSLEASRYTDKDISKMIVTFSETVSNFHSNLYKSNEIAEINKEVLKNLAIRDGFYDPYNNNLVAESKDTYARDK